VHAATIYVDFVLSKDSVIFIIMAMSMLVVNLEGIGMRAGRGG
jgi:hypothetical protein